MAEIVETLKTADKLYCNSVSIKRLDEALLALSTLTKDICSELNWQRATKLTALIKVKAAIITFFKGRLDSLRLEVAKKALDNAKGEASACAECGDFSFIESSKEAMRLVSVYLKGVYEGCDAVLSKDSATFDLARYLDTVELIDEKLKEFEQNPRLFVEIIDFFPDAECGKVAFFSVNEEVKKALYGCRNDLRLAFDGSPAQGEAVFCDLGDYDEYSLCPDYTINSGEASSPMLFVSTPLVSEFSFLLNANIAYAGKARKILQVRTGWWKELCKIKDDKSNAKERANEVHDIFLSALLQADYRKSTDIFAIYGLNDCSYADMRGVLSACSDFIKKRGNSVKIAVNDASGNLGLLELYNQLKGELALCPAENIYLSLPSYNCICEHLREIGAAELDDLKKSGVFLGYVGISVLLNQFRNHDPLWKEEYVAASKSNAIACERFLDELADDSRFVPVDWQRKTDVQKPVREPSEKYDYDKIRDVLDDEIERIFNNPDYDIYRRCEELVLYCLSADEDISAWERLDEDEKRRRIKRAVRVIATAMRCYYSNPDVEFCDDNKGSWGGLCCGGGQLIKFKTKSIQSLAWTRDAILHELYHSLQHTMTDSNYSLKWYKKTYRVSEERLQSWRDNAGAYCDIDENRAHYWLQTMEVDARDFACLCLGDKIYHSTRI